MEKELTFGEKAVGLRFNPSNDDIVGNIKKKYAENIDIINDLRTKSECSDEKTMYSIAIKELQSSQMWSVKAATWNL